MSETKAKTSLLGRVVAKKFRIESFLGGGGMGEVYRARWIELDQIVALKVIRSELVGQSGFEARFKREAKAASRLDHPSSVRIIDFGVDGELHFMAMEYLEGHHLLAELDENWPLSDARIVHILGDVLAPLSKAHELGIVHRDLKPENIMISTELDDEGLPVVKVCDFGIAKILTSVDGETSLTNMGLILGTPEYMSPEQGAGDALDARSDIYSIGVILYQMLTRRLPFESETPLGLVFKHASSPLIPPIEIKPDTNPALDAIVRRAMEKKPSDRYPTAREMRNALRAAVGRGPSAQSASDIALDGSRPNPVAHQPLSTARTVAAVETLAPSPSARKLGGPAIGGIAMVIVLLVGGLGYVALRPPGRAAGPVFVPSGDVVPTPATGAEPQVVPSAMGAAVVVAPSSATPSSATPSSAAPSSATPSSATASAPQSSGAHKPPSPSTSTTGKPAASTKVVASAVPAATETAPPPPTSVPTATSTKPVIESNPYGK